MSNVDDKDIKQDTSSVNNGGTKKDSTLKILLDPSPQVEELRKQLQKIEEEKNKAVAEAEAKVKKVEELRLAEIQRLEKEKQDALTAQKSLAEERAEYKSKLDLIVEQEFMKKKAAILERAKKDFQGNETKYKEIEAKLSDPENGPQALKQTEYLLTTMEEVFESQKKSLEKLQEENRKAEEARKLAESANQPKPAPTEGDTARLQSDNSNNDETYTESNGRTPQENLILDLYAKARPSNKNVQERAEANAKIKQLLAKVGSSFREDYKRKRPLAQEFVEKDNDNVAGYSPYNSREQIKTFKDMKRDGV